MTEYSDRLKAHLSEYKTTALNVAANGRHRVTGREYSHILPELEQRLNIIETIRDRFWDYYEANKSVLPLHTDFHHLNSSQAFAFNLFFPSAAAIEPSTPLLSAFGIHHTTIVHARFEYMPDQEERTSVDFHADLESNARLLVEVKLSESSFGAVVPRESHAKKFRDIYTPRLAQNTVPGSFDEPTFFLNYQLFRNLSHVDIARGDTLVLLVPRANRFTWEQAETFRDRFVAVGARPAVRVLATEDVLASLLASDISTSLRLHLEGVGRKYSLAA